MFWAGERETRGYVRIGALIVIPVAVDRNVSSGLLKCSIGLSSARRVSPD